MKIIKNRKIYLAVSIVLMIIGVVFAVINQSTGNGIFNFDVQFVGGTSIEANIGQQFDNNEIAQLIKDVTGDSSVSVQKTGDGTRVIIKTKYLSDAITDRADPSANAIEEETEVLAENETVEEVRETLAENETVEEDMETLAENENAEELADDSAEDENITETEENLAENAEEETEVLADTEETAAVEEAGNNDAKSAIVNALVNRYNIDNPEQNISINEVSATISTEMWQTALLAVLIACIAMLIYITIRFRDVRTGASVVLALVHDVLIVLAFYAIVRVPVNSTFIASILTVLGYSVNASIVIFDRIRENRGKMANKSKEEIVDTSIRQSITRSVFTSLTTLFTIAALYILGVESVKQFALPIIIGIICGTYSSVFLAGSIWYTLSNLKKN